MMHSPLAYIGGKSKLAKQIILSINDHPDIRDVFKAFDYKKVSLLYTVSQKGPTEANELIFSNFELKESFHQEIDLFGTYS